MKPGIKTSEFIISLIVAIVSGVAAVLGASLQEGHVAVTIVGIIGAILSAFGYTASRTSVKKAALYSGAVDDEADEETA